MKWIQSYAQPGLSKKELKGYLEVSHRLVAEGLSRKVRKEIGV